MPIVSDGQIVEAVECDPFLVVLTSKGTLLSYILIEKEKEEGSTMLQATQAPPQNPEIAEKKITHVTMINDVEGAFKLAKGKPEKEKPVIDRQTRKTG